MDCDRIHPADGVWTFGFFILYIIRDVVYICDPIWPGSRCNRRIREPLCSKQLLRFGDEFPALLLRARGRDQSEHHGAGAAARQMERGLPLDGVSADGDHARMHPFAAAVERRNGDRGKRGDFRLRDKRGDTGAGRTAHADRVLLVLRR